METTKTQISDAQRDQHIAVCRHTHDNIIFNYGSIENYIATKNTEINTAKSKLQSYYDNPHKGKSRRTAIIAGLENHIFIMKNSFANTLRDLGKLDAATPTEMPQISTEAAEMINVSVEGESVAERGESGYRVCSHCGKRFNEGYFLGDEYACSHECAVALYGGDEDQLAADLEEEEREPGTTECYWSIC